MASMPSILAFDIYFLYSSSEIVLWFRFLTMFCTDSRYIHLSFLENFLCSKTPATRIFSGTNLKDYSVSRGKYTEPGLSVEPGILAENF